jgi:hypothetical protein
VDLGARRNRLVLAILALEVNQSIPIDRLIDLAWPASPPRTAAHAIMVSVSQLRKALATAEVASDVAELVRRGSGYVLYADPLSIDVHHFRALVEQARTASGDGRKVTLLEEALRLWSGPALDGSALAETRELLCRGLDEARLTASVWWGSSCSRCTATGGPARHWRSTVVSASGWPTSSASIPARLCSSWKGRSCATTRQSRCRHRPSSPLTQMRRYRRSCHRPSPDSPAATTRWPGWTR